MMAGFGEVQEQYRKDLERDLKQARKEINDLKRQLEDHKKLVSLMVELKAEKDKLGKLTISLEIDELVKQLNEKGDE